MSPPPKKLGLSSNFGEQYQQMPDFFMKEGEAGGGICSLNSHSPVICPDLNLDDDHLRLAS